MLGSSPARSRIGSPGRRGVARQESANSGNRVTREASLRGGDVGWASAHPVRDGGVDLLSLAPEEAAWLRACWSGARPTRRPRADLARQRRPLAPALRALARSLLAPGARALDRVRHALLARPRLSRCQVRDVDGRDALDLPESAGIAPLRRLGHEEPRGPPLPARRGPSRRRERPPHPGRDRAAGRAWAEPPLLRGQPHRDGRGSCCAILTGRWWSAPPSCEAPRWCPPTSGPDGPIGAALCARGTSVIMNAHEVDRGYERIDERLRSLGARIAREPGA